MYPWKEAPVKLSPELDMVSESRPDSSWWTYAVSDRSCLHYSQQVQKLHQ